MTAFGDESGDARQKRLPHVVRNLPNRDRGRLLCVFLCASFVIQLSLGMTLRFVGRGETRWFLVVLGGRGERGVVSCWFGPTGHGDIALCCRHTDMSWSLSSRRLLVVIMTTCCGVLLCSSHNRGDSRQRTVEQQRVESMTNLRLFEQFVAFCNEKE